MIDPAMHSPAGEEPHPFPIPTISRSLAKVRAAADAIAAFLATDYEEIG